MEYVATWPGFPHAPAVETVDIVLPLEASEDAVEWEKAAAKKLGVAKVCEVRLLKHSIDARQRKVKVQLRLEVGVDGPLPVAVEPTWEVPTLPKNVRTVVIVGCGPAGMFAALSCLEKGMKPVVCMQTTFMQRAFDQLLHA